VVSGPLEGVRVIELAGIGPGPYTCMLLADAGADVIRLERIPAGGPPAADAGPYFDLLTRGRPSVGVDLKHPDAQALVLRLVEGADVLVEGFRPRVAERLGIGPDECLGRNPRLIYGRMTGWGQEGPLAEAAGHDIDYIAIAGSLWPIGRPDQPPVPPMNLVGDFGGGGMLLAFGICAALVEVARSGRGQVVDAAMVDGAASLCTMMHAFMNHGLWREERGANMLDTGAPYYEVYETADGRYFAVGAIESKFYAELLERLGLTGEDLPAQNDTSRWPELKARFGAVFRTRTRDEWAAVFDGSDACGVPVLMPREAMQHPHNRARQTFVEVDGVTQPAPVPRFSRTPAAIASPPSHPGADTDAALGAWGLGADDLVALRAAGAIG
jgi:alpha-methylacyl-CoA racemase